MSEKLEFLLRRNRGRLKFPEYSIALQKILGDSVDIEGRLVDLRESTRFEEDFHQKLVSLRWYELLETMQTRSKDRLQEEVARLFGGLAELECIVILSHWSDVGAIRLFGRELTSKAVELLEWDRDTVFGGTPDLGVVFLLDVFEDGDGREVFKVEHWVEEAEN